MRGLLYVAQPSHAPCAIHSTTFDSLAHSQLCSNPSSATSSATVTPGPFTAARSASPSGQQGGFTPHTHHTKPLGRSGCPLPLLIPTSGPWLPVLAWLRK